VTTIAGIAPTVLPAPVGVVPGQLNGALSGPTTIVVVPADNAHNVPEKLVVGDSRENAVMQITLP